MLRGNLSTRPFYNESAVSLVLLLVAAVGLALTAFNVQQIVALSAERRVLRAQIDDNNTQAERIRSEADAIQRSIDRNELTSLLVATREANQLIDQRAFSWTAFFDYIEGTLPIDVRLASVQPRVDGGVIIIGMLVVTREQRHLQEFADRLSATRVFQDVFPRDLEQNDDGTLRATIETRYDAPARTAGTGPVTAPAAGGER